MNAVTSDKELDLKTALQKYLTNILYCLQKGFLRINCDERRKHDSKTMFFQTGNFKGENYPGIITRHLACHSISG